MATSPRSAKTAKKKSTVRNSRTPVSGPAEPDASGAGDIVRIETALPNGQPDPGVITTPDASTASDELIAAISKHRHYARETDPPRV